MFSATKKLSVTNESLLRKTYWVALVVLDREISRIETAIYRRAQKIHGGISATDIVIHRLDYADPLALARNALLQQRNEVAGGCGVGVRRIHDISDNALGYIPYGTSYAIILGGSQLQPLDWVVGV